MRAHADADLKAIDLGEEDFRRAGRARRRQEEESMMLRIRV